MFNVVRRSQICGLIAWDSATISHLGTVEEVWLDPSGRVAYLSSRAGYLPLEQVADIGHSALSTYGRLVVDAPAPVQSLYQLTVESALGEPLGWVEDFLFDWHSGEIAAYILGGEIAGPWGEGVVLYPEDVQEITLEHLVIEEGAQERLRPAAEGLRGFLSEKSHQVQHLAKLIGDRVHHLISPQDHPEVVRVRVKEVSDELAAAGEHDHHALQEATAYLQHQWQGLQHHVSRAGDRAKAAFDAAWKQLTANKP